MTDTELLDGLDALIAVLVKTGRWITASVCLRVKRTKVPGQFDYSAGTNPHGRTLREAIENAVKKSQGKG